MGVAVMMKFAMLFFFLGTLGEPYSFGHASNDHGKCPRYHGGKCDKAYNDQLHRGSSTESDAGNVYGHADFFDYFALNRNVSD